MKKYEVRIKKSAQKEIRNLPKTEVIRVLKTIKSLSDDPRSPRSKKLIGTKNIWRIRVGDYRIIYSIFDKILMVEVIAVRHRKDAYD